MKTAALRRFALAASPIIALALAPAASAAPAAGGLQAKLGVPLPTSARVLSDSAGTVQVCFDRPVKTVDHPADLELLGFDANRATAATSSSGPSSADPRCVGLGFPAGGNDAPVSEFTRVTVLSKSITATGGTTNLASAAVALDNTSQRPRPGNTGGPDLVGTPRVSTDGAGDTVITYTFDQALDQNPSATAPAGAGITYPVVTPATGFGYYGADGTVVTCGAPAAFPNPGLSFSGNTATCVVPAATASVTPPVRFFVLDKAQRDRPTPFSCCDITPVGSAGDDTDLPQLIDVEKTGAAEATVTYDEPVTVRNKDQFLVYGSDGASSSPDSVSQPAGHPDEVVLRFSPLLALAAYKVVGVADEGAASPGGGAVLSTDSPPLQSATSYVPVATAPIQAGRVDTPDLTSVTVDPNTNTAVFAFDGLVASAGQAKDYFLFDHAGNSTTAASIVSTTRDAAATTSRVTVSFPAAAIANAQAAEVGDRAVVDFTGKQGLRNTVAVTALAKAPGALGVYGPTGYVSPGGRLTLFGACPAAQGCKTTLRLSSAAKGHPQLAQATVSEPGGFAGTVHLQLPPGARRALGRAPHHLAAQLALLTGAQQRRLSLTLVRTAASPRPVPAHRSGRSPLEVLGDGGFVGADGKVSLLVGCVGQSACTGPLTVKAGKATVGSMRSLKLAAGRDAVVRVALGKQARQRLAHAGTLVVTITVSGPRGARQSVTLRLVAVR